MKTISPRIKQRFLNVLITIGCVGIGLSLSICLFYKTGNYTNFMITMFLAELGIMILTKKLFYGISGAFLEVLGSGWFFLQTGILRSRTGNSELFLLTILGISLFLSKSIALRQEQEKIAKKQEERTNKLNEINNQLLITSGLENTIQLILKFCVDITGRTSIFYREDPQHGSKGILMAAKAGENDVFRSSHEVFMAHWAFINKKDAGVGTAYVARSACSYFTFKIQNEVVGVLGVYCKHQKKLSKYDWGFLKLLVSQGVMALERQLYLDEQQAFILESEKEKMRSNLLRAVSHDLRTPLTGMMGASATYLEHEDHLKEEEKKKLVKGIYDDSTWLLHMVENLLSVTRIGTEGTVIQKMLEPVEEIVGEAVARFKKRYQKASLVVQVPEEFLMVPLDVTLVEQVLLNLMENAVKYSKSDQPIYLYVEKQGEDVEFRVEDCGVGLSPDQIPHIFDGYTRDPGESSDTAKGMGIGLSICKTIILAHGGTIEGKNRLNGGASFRFTLPLEGDKET